METLQQKWPLTNGSPGLPKDFRSLEDSGSLRPATVAAAAPGPMVSCEVRRAWTRRRGMASFSLEGSGPVSSAPEVHPGAPAQGPSTHQASSARAVVMLVLVTLF